MTAEQQAEIDGMIALFSRIGLPANKCKESATNRKLCPALRDVIREANVEEEGCDWSKGALLYELAANVAKDGTGSYADSHRAYIAQRIRSNDLTSSAQVQAALKFIKDRSASVPIPAAEFNKECGVGVVVDAPLVQDVVQKILFEKKTQLLEERYRLYGSLLKQVKEDERLRWADGKLVKDAVDGAFLELLGPKDERDVPQKAVKKKPASAVLASTEKKPAGSAPVTSFSLSDPTQDPFFMVGDLSRLHKPGGNKQIKPSLMDQHLKETGGIVMTRFPPEPNGYLHIGHAKAINVNFGYAAAHGGKCYLRYDDTNPEAEEERFFTTIQDSVEWLGFKPWKITYSSDHFDRLYELAVKLIRVDKAYVCHCTGEQIHEMRGGDEKGPRRACEHRSRPIEESLREFQRMKEGQYKEGEAILRMKMDLENPNPQFWDLVAYRVLYSHHYRSKDKWCIYPTYDYTHCLCDSFENITHSLCTTEFILNRESYYWLCDALEVYKPVQWEYGRLNITNTVLSKRKLTKLVEQGIVNGWDDPRLYTLVALRRRGFPPQAINAFVRDCGVSTSQSVIDVRRLEGFVRSYLDDHGPRVMAVIDPVLVILKNLPEDHYEEFQVPYFPKTKQEFAGAYPAQRALPFTRYVYIDRSDFLDSATPDPNFFRLMLNKAVNLLNLPHPILCTGVIRSSDGKRIEALEAEYVTPDHPLSKSASAKSYIQWIALSSPTPTAPKRIASPVVAEIRLYNDLFLHSNPMDKTEVPGGWLSDINPNSLQVVENAFVESGIIPKQAIATPAGGATPRDDRLPLAVEDKVQFVRNGYYCVDTDSKTEWKSRTVRIPKMEAGGTRSATTFVEKQVQGWMGWVFNRTVSLREDSSKKK